MDYTYRKFRNTDLEYVTPILYVNEPNNIYSPSEEDTITILCKDKVIAFITIDFFVMEQVLFIYMFEVFEKNKGHGRTIIEMLQNKVNNAKVFNRIELNPTSCDSGLFWQYMGFEYINKETMVWLCTKTQIND